MPYIIATLTPSGPRVEHPKREWFGYARRAVATLEEAREIAFNVIDGTGHPLMDADAITEQGGTIGPLPDGTVIEVAQASWRDIAGGPWDVRGDWKTDLIDAYNAQVSA